MANMAGSPAGRLKIAGKDGVAYVRNLDSWHSGVEGISIHHIPEEPTVFTASHSLSGLRIGRGRFKSISDACNAIMECFGGTVNFNRDLNAIRRDFKFALCLEKFLRICVQVPKNMDGITRIDFAAKVINDGADSAINSIKRQ